MLGGQVDETRTDSFSHEILRSPVWSILGDLNLELAAAKAKLHDHLATGLLDVSVIAGVGCSTVDGEPPVAVVGPHAGIVLLDLVPAGDSEVDLAFSDEGGDVGGGEEDESYGEVLDEGDVEAVFALELDISALEEVQRGLVETTLWTPLGFLLATNMYKRDKEGRITYSSGPQREDGPRGWRGSAQDAPLATWSPNTTASTEGWRVGEDKLVDQIHGFHEEGQCNVLKGSTRVG